MEASIRRLFGCPVQFVLKFSGLVLGVVGLIWHAPTFPFFPNTRCSRGPSLSQVMLSLAIFGTITPSDSLPAQCDFPFVRLYAPTAPGLLIPGPGRVSPVPIIYLLTIPLPLPRRVLWHLHLQVLLVPSMAFTVSKAVRLPLFPFMG